MRFVLVGLFVCLVAAASSAAGEVRAVTDPVAGSYIVVFKSNAVSAASVGAEATPARAGARRHRQVRLPACARGLRRQALGRRGRRARPPSERRLRRAGSGRPRVPDADARDLGARSDRPAKPAAEQLVHLQPDRSRCPRVRHRHGHPGNPSAVQRPDGQRRRLHQRRPGHERLQRPRDPRRRHDWWNDVRSGQVGDAPRGPGPELPGLRNELRRDRRHRLGETEPHLPRRGEHEPWRWS